MPKKNSYQAQEIAQYLISLDSEHKYFTNRKLNGFFVSKIPSLSMGNFRLNVHLQIAQMLYYAHYEKPLFTDQIKAYEYGGYVKTVYQNFPNLLKERKSEFNLTK